MMEEHQRKTAWWIFAGLSIILLGTFGTFAGGFYVRQQMKVQLVEHAQVAAAMIDAESIRRLTGTSSDLGQSDYEELKSSMVRVRELNPSVHFAYLMGYRDDELFIYMDSEPVDSEEYSPPGDTYGDASQEKVQSYLARASFAEGPYTDRWGNWVSGYAPVIDPRNPDGPPLAMMGLDIDTRLYKQNSFLAQLLPAVVTFLSVVLLVVLYKGLERRRDYIAKIKGEEEKLRVILQQLPVGVLVMRVTDRKVEFANKIITDIFGRDFDFSVPADKVTEVYKIEHEDGSLFTFDELPPGITLRTGKMSKRLDVYVRHPDGQRVNTRGFAVPIYSPEGRMEQIVLLIEDVTKEREVEKMKSDFVSLASHQLRTPLVAIKWFAEVLLAQKEGAGGRNRKKYLQQIYDSNAQLIALVEDLLNVSRIETGKNFVIKKERIDFIPVLDSLLLELKGYAKKYRVVVQKKKGVPERYVLSADGDKLRQAFSNIIGNAIKYSHPNGVVDVGYSRAKNGKSTFIVTDHGIGIPKAEHKKVFEKFFRAQNVQKLQVGGTGLGLHIAKAIIEKHGGRIWFESEEDVGTTFYIELPKA